MTLLNTYLPFSSSVVSFIFAGFVFKRYAERKGLHLLLWGVGMVFYGIGGFCEGYYGAAGWDPLIFRLWYLSGAILVAAWLGQGTVYLLAKKKWANAAMIILLVASIAAAVFVFTYSIEAPTDTTLEELSGKVVYPELSDDFSPRFITPFFNLYGTLGLVGGAIYSAWIFYRKRVLLHRTIGNIVIAVGGLFPAVGGSFSRFGIPNALYISEFIGVVLIFAGYLRATTPMKGEASEPAAAD
jgi:hypothetical protein